MVAVGKQGALALPQTKASWEQAITEGRVIVTNLRVTHHRNRPVPRLHQVPP